jgi:hypothetical protein
MPALANPGEPDVRKRGIIHAFSGTRGHVEVEPSSLSMDATALLSAELLGVTQTIFDHFSEIAIPHSTLGWLFEEKRRILFHQPSRVSDAHELRRLIDDGSLKPFEATASIPAELIEEVGIGLASMLAVAITDRSDDMGQRLVVHPYPVHRVDSLMQEEANLAGYESCLCSCLAVVEKLVERGELTITEAQKCRAYLALHEQSWPADPNIEDSAVLYLDDVTVSYLQHLELLPRLRKAGLTVFISAREVAESDALIEYESQATRATSLVESLRMRLRRGIESGKIRVGQLLRTDDKEDGRLARSHPSLAILNLSVTTDAMVVDDRFVNQYRTITLGDEQRPLLTSLDVLNILRARNVISGDQLAEFKTALRRSGISHVPLEQSELDRYLSMAATRDGKLVETAELKAVRENVLQIRMTDVLQLPQEMVWLNGLFEACFNSLKAQWYDGVDEGIARARSDWLIDLMDVRGWSHRFVGIHPDASLRYRGQLIALMMLPASLSPAVRRLYWGWFEDRVLIHIKEEDRPLYDGLVLQAAGLVELGLRDVPTPGGIHVA